MRQPASGKPSQPGRPRRPRKPKPVRFAEIRLHVAPPLPRPKGREWAMILWAAGMGLLAFALLPNAQRAQREDAPYILTEAVPEPPKPPPSEPPKPKPPVPVLRKAPPAIPKQFGLDEKSLAVNGEMAVAPGNTVATKPEAVIKLGPLAEPTSPPVDPDTLGLAGKWVSLARVSALPKVSVAVTPAYSPEMRRNRIAGKVKAKVLVDSDGRVAQIRILEDLGFGTGDSTRAALRKMKFDPGLMDNIPVAVWIPFTFKFELQE
jgi:periplasmic protein TonB